LSVYLDTSVLVSLFVRDGHTDRVLSWAQTQTEPPQVSDWAVTEFSSALGLRRRLGQLEEADRANLELALDGWQRSISVCLSKTFSRMLNNRSPFLNRLERPMRLS
jgi:predicted nucleic acid-binding protein